MDGRKHDETTPPPQESCPQDALCAKAGESHAQEVGNLLLVSRFEQAQAGNVDAQAFFHEALRRRDATVQAFLERKANQGNSGASLLLQGYYLSLLLSIRAGDEYALDVLCEQVVKQKLIAHELLVELVARDDQVARRVLYSSYDLLLKQLLRGNMSALAFFQEQLQSQNDGALAFLSERATHDTRVSTVLLHPYYQLLLPLAIGNEQRMAVFRKQLRRNDEVLQAFLAQQVEKGSDDAFRVLWESYRPEIEPYVQQMVVGASLELVAELTEATFEKAWRSLPNRKHKEQKMQFRAWLHKVAASEVIDYLRRRQTGTSTYLTEMDVDLLTPGPEDEVCKQENIACLKQALLRLSKRARTCVLMADIEGYSTREIAEKLGIQQSTVTSYLTRSRAKLRDYYFQAINHDASDIKSKGEREDRNSITTGIVQNSKDTVKRSATEKRSKL